MTPMKSPKTRIPVGVRRALAATAITAVAMAGWHLNTSTQPGIGAIGLIPGATAEPTGPPGPTGGMTDGGGSQFQPPGQAPQLPEYQGGNNLPPMNQDSGISIYNSGAPQAGQQAGGQQAGQQPQQGAQQPQHGTQPPDYQTATPYTQGPGQSNPDYQAPQQNSPQQGSQQQPQQQQPNQQQQQPQNKQDDNTQQLKEQQQQCEQMGQQLGQKMIFIAAAGGRGALIGGRWVVAKAPGAGDAVCEICDEQTAQQQLKDNKCGSGFIAAPGSNLTMLTCTRIDGDPTRDFSNSKDVNRLTSQNNCNATGAQNTVQLTTSKSVATWIGQQTAVMNGGSTTNTVGGEIAGKGSIKLIELALKATYSNAQTGSNSTTVTNISQEVTTVTTQQAVSVLVDAGSKGFLVPTYTLIPFTQIVSSSITPGGYLLKHDVLAVPDGGTASYTGPALCG